ncbi:hypothetical protein H4582DRAFT_1320631 [Lactarius indigo]|nr:hypothetical protein H4582DRAFT_1320631 [Lactarius indigo]
MMAYKLCVIVSRFPLFLITIRSILFPTHYSPATPLSLPAICFATYLILSSFELQSPYIALSQWVGNIGRLPVVRSWVRLHPQKLARIACRRE